VPTPIGARLIDRYRTLSARQLELLTAQAGEVYDDEIDPDDIAEATGRVARRLVPIVTAGQLQQQQLTLGFYRAYSISELGRVLEPLPPIDLAGQRLGGQGLLEGMAPLGSMMLGSIAKGQDLPAVLDYGRTLFERFADATARQAADAEKANQDQREEITGWEGIVDANSCDRCQGNAGVHDLDEEMYRHGNCLCERVPVLAQP
jgi:hypothetical protein